MGILRRSAVVAGACGLAVAALLAPVLFVEAPQLGLVAAGSGLEAVHSTLTILWIVLPALALYEYQAASGGIARIRDALGGLTTDHRMQVILIAWFFGLFMEGAGGFGTPVALAAPLLAGLGHPPVRAVALALLGHAAGVSFGAVGTPTLAQVGLTGLDPRALAGTAAALHAVISPILLLATVRLAAEGPLTRRDLGWTALAWASFALPSLALAWFVGPEVPSLGGAMIGLAIFVTVLARRTGGARVDLRALLPDLAPYLAILALVLATRLVGPVGAALAGLSLDWTLAARFGGSFAPLYHPGTLLMLGLVLGAAAGAGTAQVAPALRRALGRMVPVAFALFAMLALSRLMVHAGMIAALAEAAARTGAFWPLLAPSLGVLGTFITGSATASNILFTELQVSAATSLSLPPVLMAAGQSFGAAVGNVIAPHNIIAGSATVGLTGREGDVLARTVRPGATAVVAGGLLILALAAIA
ncbi:L-lactate permease [Histidinibacterium aquaticum]|uniref:L-lactate permease n=2 Tax=Histidinibacterium aquaticum TaxID=2613962 RepID=A0A5J5GQR0_9RHOB|nr:L-lactate permease [Histidinibacterium aquaticum]